MILRRYGDTCQTNPLTGQMECSKLIVPGSDSPAGVGPGCPPGTQYSPTAGGCRVPVPFVPTTGTGPLTIQTETPPKKVVAAAAEPIPPALLWGGATLAVVGLAYLLGS